MNRLDTFVLKSQHEPLGCCRENCNQRGVCIPTLPCTQRGFMQLCCPSSSSSVGTPGSPCTSLQVHSYCYWLIHIHMVRSDHNASHGASEAGLDESPQTTAAHLIRFLARDLPPLTASPLPPCRLCRPCSATHTLTLTLWQCNCVIVVLCQARFTNPPHLLLYPPRFSGDVMSRDPPDWAAVPGAEPRLGLKALVQDSTV